MDRSRRQVISERVVSMPNYMTMSREDASEILSSFGAIFSATFHSLKLIQKTISLNMSVIANSFKGDQAAIKKNFEDFKVERDKIHDSMKDDLKYFRKAVGDSPLEKGIVASVAFAANPILGASMIMDTPSNIMGTSADSDSGGSTTGKKKSEKDKLSGPSIISSRLKAAMQFFGYRDEGKLSEAAQPAAAQPVAAPAPASPPGLSKEQQAAAARLQQKSKQFFSMQINRANQLMASMVPQIEAVRSVLRAEDYNSLATAASSPVLKDLGINVSSIAGLDKSIAAELEKKQKEDPETFSKEAAEIRKKFPDLQAKDDVELLKKVAFSSVKGPAQQNILKAVNDRSQAIMSSMELPIDANTRNMLMQTPEGKQYLGVMDTLQGKLEGFSQQIKK